jgi:hypothetical protein
MDCDELITRPRSPTVCKMIMKLKAEARAQGDCRASDKKKRMDGFHNVLSPFNYCVPDHSVKRIQKVA